MSLKKIDANLVRIVRDGNKLNTLVHATAMMVMAHATNSGDCTRALSLVLAMPASYRRTTLVKWFEKFSPIRVVLVNNVVGMLKKDEKGYKPFDLTKANEQPFFEIAENTPEQQPPMDLAAIQKWITQQAKGLEKRAEDGKIDASEVLTVKALAELLRSIKIVHVAAVNENIPTPAPSDTPKNDFADAFGLAGLTKAKSALAT